MTESGLTWTAADVKAALGDFLKLVAEQERLARQE